MIALALGTVIKLGVVALTAVGILMLTALYTGYEDDPWYDDDDGLHLDHRDGEE